MLKTLIVMYQIKSNFLQTALLLVFAVNISYPQSSIIWSKYYDKDVRDEAYFVSATSDSGCIISGVVDGYNTVYDLFILKLDSKGDSLWSRTLGGKQTQERGLCVRQTSNGCYIVTGYIENQWSYKIYLLKLDSYGDTLWSRTYEKGVGGSVIQTHDCGYVIAADKDTAPVRTAGLIKTDSVGELLWTRTYNIINPISNYILETSTGDFIVGCSGYSPSKNKFIDVYCTDSQGNLKWQHFNDKHESINSIIELHGGNIVGVGSSSDDQYSNLKIIGTDDAGKVLFVRDYSSGDYTYCMGTGIELSGNNFIITAKCDGYGDIISNQWTWVLVTDLNGDTLKTQMLDNTNSYPQSGQLNSLSKISDNQFFAAGWFHKDSSYNRDFWITKLKLDQIVNQIDSKNDPNGINQVTLKQNYPNPFNGNTRIEYWLPTTARVQIQLFDVLGRHISTLIEKEESAGLRSIIFNSGRLVSGIYFYKISAGPFSSTRKLIIAK